MNYFSRLAGLVLMIWVGLSACGKTGTVRYYVSPEGNDQHEGTKSEPFRTVERAQEAVRKSRAEDPGKSFEVILRGGTYTLEKPIVFSSGDSGMEDKPVIYRAMKGEEPVFTGSVELRNWSLLEDSVRLSKLSADAQGKVWVTDLKAANISRFGDATDAGVRPELFCDGQMQILARWPNEGFVRAGKVKGRTVLPPDYMKRTGTREGVFEYLDTRMNRWASESDIHLGGYWYWDWSDQFQKVARVDTNNRTFYLREPYHHYGYRDSLRYFGVNLFQEIDIPGEWYLDRTEGLLFWYPAEGKSPETSLLTLSVYDEPFMVEIREGSHIVLEGLSFQEGRGSAISIQGGRDCKIVNCRMERFGRDGIHVMGGTDHVVSGCLLRTLGHGGMKVKGGDRKTLTPANHLIEQNVVEYFSLYKRTYEPAVHLDGCGMFIRNNRFSHSSSSAMRVEGNDFVIEYNEISHVVNESDDQGGLDMFYNPSYRGNIIRYNRWSDIRGGTVHGAAGVRLDDMISGVVIYGNIFERCGALHFGGVQIHGGKDNLVSNNLFYDCFAAFSFSSWGEKRWLDQLDSPVIRKKLFEDVDIRSDIYQSKYPELKRLREGVDVNTLKNNLIVDCPEVDLRNKGNQIMENNPSVSSEGKDLAYFCSKKVLRQYGMEPIPLDKIGPLENRWVE